MKYLQLVGGCDATPNKIQIYINIILSYSTVIDLQLQKLNNCFSEVIIELLLCIAFLNPSDSFVVFDKEKLVRLAKFYPDDFFVFLDKYLGTWRSTLELHF